MKIQIMSDIHLEFGGYTPISAGADVLVLAGDIIPIKILDRWESFNFFEAASKNFDKVYMVFGNHEYYGQRLGFAMQKFRGWLEENNFSNIEVLENNTSTYKGINFIGATLWTNFNKNDFLVKSYGKQSINDFRLIKDYDWRKITPDEIYSENQVSENFIRKALGDFGQNSVVITHHAPCELSVHKKYSNDMTMNYLYFSDYSNMIFEHQPKLWIHGHMHNSNDYMLENTRVISNPRGYFGHELNDNFSDTFIVEV